MALSEQRARAREQAESTDSLREYISDSGRGSLLTYTRFTYPVYEPNWHHEVVASHLERVARGEIKRLMVLVPPRYGKSELASIRFPAWYLGREPRKKVILASYNDQFSLYFGKRARNLCQSEVHRCVFPSSWVRKDSSSGSLWELTAGGKFVAVGRGGSVTGHGADLLILDDMIKNIQEAYSENLRETVWDWYKTTLYTRLEKDGAIVVVNTRWHSDDLVGRLLETEPEKWVVLKMPAIAEMDYIYGEHTFLEGETLWPDKYPIENVLETKELLGSHFDSIYQQDPTPDGGNIIKSSMWNYFTVLPEKIERVVQSWDTGFKTGESSSYSACTTWVVSENAYYLVDAWWGKLEFPELKKEALRIYEKHTPHEVLIEDKASGQSLIQELRSTTRMPVRAVTPERDKEARAHAVTPLFEAGKVMIPKSEPWSDEVIRHAAGFPNSKNTDVVDSITQALQYMGYGRNFKYTYHGGVWGRRGSKKSIFDMEREGKKNGDRQPD